MHDADIDPANHFVIPQGGLQDDDSTFLPVPLTNHSTSLSPAFHKPLYGVHLNTLQYTTPLAAH